jgi:hypothetical protein
MQKRLYYMEIDRNPLFKGAAAIEDRLYERYFPVK